MKKVTTPKLVCNITGRDRVTTREYVDGRLAELGVTEVHFYDNYVCKDAMKLLRQGKTVDEIRKQLGSDKKHPISADDIKVFLSLNGKQRGGAAGPAISAREAKFLDQQAKVTVPGKAPEAPKTAAPTKTAAGATK